MTGWRSEEVNDELPEIVFVSYRQVMKENGELSFSFDVVTYNDAAGADGSSECITLINSKDSTAMTCWVNQHPDAKFPQSVTDGVRLGRALDRAFKGETPEETVEIASEQGGVLKVSKNQVEGQEYWAWLWEITPNA
jgi:ABC-type cobalamin/Fe3+-siderophores transport system ATPase subunit